MTEQQLTFYPLSLSYVQASNNDFKLTPINNVEFLYASIRERTVHTFYLFARANDVINKLPHNLLRSVLRIKTLLI